MEVATIRPAKPERPLSCNYCKMSILSLESFFLVVSKRNLLSNTRSFQAVALTCVWEIFWPPAYL